MSNKASTPDAQRGTRGTTGQTRIQHQRVLSTSTQVSSTRRAPNDPRPVRRTPGGEDDDEISNYMADHHQSPPAMNVGVTDAPIWKEAKRQGSSEIHSVAGTEQQSIVDKISWRHVKGLYDMVMQQKDEASRGQSNMVVDASKFGASDALSDLSDNTSREPNIAEERLSRGDANGGRGAVGSTTPQREAQTGSRRTHEYQKQSSAAPLPSDAESEYIATLLNYSGSLSVSALEGLVSHLTHALQVKYSEEQQQQQPYAHSDGLGFSSSMDEVERRPRTNSNNLPSSAPSPRLTPQKAQLSQSVPSSFFSSSAKVKSAPAHNRVGSTKPPGVNSPRNVPGSSYGDKKNQSFDDEDEEVLQLVSDDGKTMNEKATPAPTSTPNASFRGMSTPSPKHKRVGSTPTKTPPIRHGAIPPVAQQFMTRDSFEEFAVQSPAVLISAAQISSLTKVPKTREASPPIISRRPATDAPATAVLAVRKRKDAGSVSSVGSLTVSSTVSGVDLRISVAAAEGSSGKRHQRQGSGSGESRQHLTESRVHLSESSRNRSLTRLSEIMSPRSAFDDRSVNSNMSSSSASHSNYQ